MGSEDDKTAGKDCRDKQPRFKQGVILTGPLSNAQGRATIAASRSMACAAITFQTTQPPIRPVVIPARRRVLLQVKIAKGLKIKQNVVRASLLKRACSCENQGLQTPTALIQFVGFFRGERSRASHDGSRFRHSAKRLQPARA